MIPSAEEFMRKHQNSNHPDMISWLLVEFTRLHVKAALEAAANNVKTKLVPPHLRLDYPTPTMWDIEIDKESIISAYPETNIT